MSYNVTVTASVLVGGVAYVRCMTLLGKIKAAEDLLMEASEELKEWGDLGRVDDVNGAANALLLVRLGLEDG